MQFDKLARAVPFVRRALLMIVGMHYLDQRLGRNRKRLRSQEQGRDDIMADCQAARKRHFETYASMLERESKAAD